MERKSFIVLSILLLVGYGQANLEAEKLPLKPILLVDNKLSDSAASTTAPPSPPTTSTTASPSPPTTSTTASPSPPTTTSAPTTTVAPVTTTSKPEPKPKPEKGKWAYSNSTGNNETCVIVEMALQFNISYQAKDQQRHAVFNLPVNKTITLNGSCGMEQQNIVLKWPSDIMTSPNTLQLIFDKNTTSNKFSLSTVTATVYMDSTNFPQANDLNKTIILVHNDKVFSAPLTMSYRCGKEQNVTLNGNSSWIFISHVQMQAFHADKGNIFGSAVDCDYVDVPDIVPIAVGCAMGALVLIVLIAYLVGRKRNRGYLSM